MNIIDQTYSNNVLEACIVGVHGVMCFNNTKGQLRIKHWWIRDEKILYEWHQRMVGFPDLKTWMVLGPNPWEENP